jgi:HEPN domain-containing protein
MKEKNDLVKEWLIRAEHDLTAAELLLKYEETLNDVIAFHCQQAVEKYLKGYMVYLNLPFVKTHEIGELITKLEEKDSRIFELKEDADSLTDYAVEVRYPETFAIPSFEEINEAIEIAKKVKNYVHDKIIIP